MTTVCFLLEWNSMDKCRRLTSTFDCTHNYLFWIFITIIIIIIIIELLHYFSWGALGWWGGIKGSGGRFLQEHSGLIIISVVLQNQVSTSRVYRRWFSSLSSVLSRLLAITPAISFFFISFILSYFILLCHHRHFKNPMALPWND